MKGNRSKNTLLYLCFSEGTWRQKDRIDRIIRNSICGILHSQRDKISTSLGRHMVTITHKQAKLKQFEGLKSIQDDVNKFRIDLFEL